MMRNFNQHIAKVFIFLLAYPGINNTLHFVLTSHDYIFEGTVDQSNFTDETLNHLCEQSLFALNNFIDFSIPERNISSKIPNQKPNYFYTIAVDFVLNESLAIRGPPLKSKL
jgi:hypothetical protein